MKKPKYYRDDIKRKVKISVEHVHKEGATTIEFFTDKEITAFELADVIHEYLENKNNEHKQFQTNKRTN